VLCITLTVVPQQLDMRPLAAVFRVVGENRRDEMVRRLIGFAGSETQTTHHSVFPIEEDLVSHGCALLISGNRAELDVVNSLDGLVYSPYVPPVRLWYCQRDRPWRLSPKVDW
jgi:hypothetical protein